MGNQPKDVRQWIQELITQSAMEQMRVMQRFNEVLKRVARGEMDPQAVNEEIMRFAQEESTRYVGDLTRLSLSFYSALLELGRNYNDRLLHQLSGGANNHNAPTAQRAAPPQQVEMALHAPAGEEIVRSFVIENKRAEATDISFLVSEFTDATGASVFRPPLQLQPARFTLRPGEERVVTLQLPLLEQFFTPGQRYAATVLVRGHDDLVLALDVQVDAPPAKQPSAPSRAADDLTRLKGIGPEYARRLAAVGIVTFAGLAALDDEALARTLGAAAARRAQRFQWKEQARLAATGDEVKLKALQMRLDDR